MLQKLLHKHLTNLGLNYIEVLCLFEFINRHKIVYKSDFYKICEFKIRDKDRDEYSMKKKNTGKYNDIYHDRHFKHGLTTMFLRTIVGLTNFDTIDSCHWYAIKYGNNQNLQKYYDRIMKRFWADKVLSTPVKLKISIRLTDIKLIDKRARIFENLVSVQYAKLEILHSFFFGNVSEINLPEFKVIKIEKRYTWNTVEFQNPLVAQIKDDGRLEEFKRQILDYQSELNQDIQDRKNYRIYLKNHRQRSLSSFINRNQHSTINRQSTNNNQDLPQSKRFKYF